MPTFTTAERWKQPRCPPAMRIIHVVEYYSAKKRSEILSHATTWMDVHKDKKPDADDYVLWDPIYRKCPK